MNCKDWLRNFKIVLNSKKLGYVIDQEPLILLNRPTTNQKATFDKWVKDDNRIKCYILASMSNNFNASMRISRLSNKLQC